MSNGLRPSARSWFHCQPVYQMPPNARPTLACLVRSRCLNGCHWDPRDHLASRRRIRKLEKNGCISCVSAHILWVSSGKWPIDIYKSKSNLPCDAGNHFVWSRKRGAIFTCGVTIIVRWDTTHHVTRVQICNGNGRSISVTDYVSLCETFAIGSSPNCLDQTVPLLWHMAVDKWCGWFTTPSPRINQE